MGFNFGQIESVVAKYMDTDFVDVWRVPAGLTNREEVYSNIPCHAEILQADNPDPETVDANPIVSGLRIHVNNAYDLQNEDYLVVKKMSNGNEILTAYYGLCGEPAVTQARKSVAMTMKTHGAVDVDPTPPPEPPPENPVRLDLSYQEEGTLKVLMQATSDKSIGNVGDMYTLVPPEIPNYTPVSGFLAGGTQFLNFTTFPYSFKLDGDYFAGAIRYRYEEVPDELYFRILADGVYVKDNGLLGSGLHLFWIVPIQDYEQTGLNTYTIKTRSKSVVHPELGTINFEPGLKIKIYDTDEWAQITSVPTTDGVLYSFNITPYTPTVEESAAPIATYYDQ